MSFVVIPLQAIPNQSVSYVLNGTAYTIDVNTLRDQPYITIWQAGEIVLSNRALRSFAPVGFGLQLADTQGEDDPPSYTGFGTRWLLIGQVDDE